MVGGREKGTVIEREREREREGRVRSIVLHRALYSWIKILMHLYNYYVHTKKFPLVVPSQLTRQKIIIVLLHTPLADNKAIRR